MLKRKLCQADITWELTCDGPLLIRDERFTEFKKNELKTIKKEGDVFPDCIFLSRSTKTDFAKAARESKDKLPELPFFVPGTSIRGPFRAQAERIIRSLLPENAQDGLTACDPFLQEKQADRTLLSCSKRLAKAGKEKSIYCQACPACKLFGCAGLGSRITFTDADIEHHVSVFRDMIGIDRFTGGVYSPEKGGGANMRFHVLENTKFTTRISVANFEMWQIGLLAYVFRDFAEQAVPIGYGKTKGFGMVKGEVKDIILTYPKAASRIEHLASLMKDENGYYDVMDCEAPEFDHMEDLPQGMSFYFQKKITDIPSFMQTVAPVFNCFIDELNKRAGEGIQ